jgi:hypothetical protein
MDSPHHYRSAPISSWSLLGLYSSCSTHGYKSRRPHVGFYSTVVPVSIDWPSDRAVHVEPSKGLRHMTRLRREVVVTDDELLA